MKSIFILIGFLFFSTGLAENNKKPNVLFISIDDMNHWISSMRDYQAIYDYPKYKTPNIDKLLARGMFFSNAHVPGASCKPSRVSVFTGVHISNHGVYRNPHSWLLAPAFKNRDDVSLMQRFRKEGYFVAPYNKKGSRCSCLLVCMCICMCCGDFLSLIYESRSNHRSNTIFKKSSLSSIIS